MTISAPGPHDGLPGLLDRLVLAGADQQPRLEAPAAEHQRVVVIAAPAGRRAATDEGDDLDLVAVPQDRLLPGPARDDVLVAFDRHPGGIDAQMREQARPRSSRGGGSGFAVDGKTQVVHGW